MNVPEYMITGLQSAAISLCHKLLLNPYEDLGNEPAWQYFARKMALHQMMVQEMRQFGHLV